MFVETDLKTKIEKLSEEKNMQSQKISQLEQTVQKSSKLLFQRAFEIIELIKITFFFRI